MCQAWAIQISFKGSRRRRGPGIKISELPHSQWDGGAREPRLGLRRPAGHRKRMLQQSFGAVRGSHRHRVIARNLSRRSILGLEASGRIGGGPERPGLLEPPLTAPRQLIVMLELPGVVLVHPKRCRRHRLHILRRHRDRFVRPGVACSPPPSLSTLPARSFLRV